MVVLKRLGQPRHSVPKGHLVLLTREEYERQQEAWKSFNHPAWQPFKEAWRERFPDPPPGSASDDAETTLRSRLWSIADSRPNELGRWVREAPPSSVFEVMAYVFAKWSELRADIEDYDPIATPQERRDALELLGDIVERVKREVPA